MCCNICEMSNIFTDKKAMELEKLFTEALGIKAPWKVISLKFDSEKQKLSIDVDFEKGATFEYVDPESGEVGHYKAYDTRPKSWRHLNFLSISVTFTQGRQELKPLTERAN
jgi:hypothetical protein